MKGFHGDLEKATRENNDFRRVLYTGRHSQLVLMSLAPGEEIGVEVHPNNDQFLRFESGQGLVTIGDNQYDVGDGAGILVPAGAYHNVKNNSSTTPLKLYTLYSPPHHQDNLRRTTKAEAEAEPADFDGQPSE